MTKAQQLIEERYQRQLHEDPDAAEFELLGVPMRNGTPLFAGDDRLVIGFTNLQDRSQFVQDAEAKGFSTDELDSDAYPTQIPDTYPFLVIVWK